ncbi:hypothetical protein AAHN97_15190 [Chitinophaga niabensis]|uniref:hypothetical protein n=1 Tax=Chitinophaga niabensis TaxID=536979 RepID=UPI0031BA3AD9
MRTVEPRSRVRVAKRKIRSQMKKWGVMVKDVAEATTYHPQTVKDALNPELPYWNEAIAQKAMELVKLKQETLKTLPVLL